MIVAAGLLVLVGLGLFVGGVLTGETNLYWACVGACVVAAVLLFLARRRMTAPAAPAAATTAPVAPASAGRHADGGSAGTAPAAPAGATAVSADGSAGRAGAAVTGTTTVDGLPTHTPATPDPATTTASADGGEPPVEEVEVTDLLLVVDLTDEVLVVDEHPRYHVEGCRHLTGRETIPIPLDEARTDGFTPCGTCRPDATLAGRVRARKGPGAG